MKAKFISSTNEMFNVLKDKEVELDIGMRASYTFDPTNTSFDFRHGSAVTSQIQKIEYNEISRNYYHIVISTRNSEYVFSVGEPSEETPLTEEEILNLQMAILF